MQERNQWTAQLNPVVGQFAGTKHDQVVGVLAQVAFVSRIAQAADEARGGYNAACAGQNRQNRQNGEKREEEDRGEEEAAADRRQAGQ